MIEPVLYLGIRVPQLATLVKYGLELPEWERMVRRFDGACWVCEERPAGHLLVIDHEHVLFFKRLPPEKRKRYVRGVCDVICNGRILSRFATPKRLRGAARYLEEYAEGSEWLPS